MKTIMSEGGKKSEEINIRLNIADEKVSEHKEI